MMRYLDDGKRATLSAESPVLLTVVVDVRVTGAERLARAMPMLARAWVISAPGIDCLRERTALERRLGPAMRPVISPEFMA